MCGIAGYSLDASSDLDRTLLAQALLAGIADRGSDAVGYAYRGPTVPITVLKRRSGASGIIAEISVPRAGTQALVHVRDYTKGHPGVDANNHPIRHGTVVGIHNGVIANDEEIFARPGLERARPEMEVDSEAIFALVARTPRRRRARVLEELRGSMAAAWLDERAPDEVVLARGIGRPLWIGAGGGVLLFASTPDTLELAARYARTGPLELAEVEEGAVLAARNGRVVRRERFEPDRTFTKATPPAVRAPEERATCFERLAAIAAAAA